MGSSPGWVKPRLKKWCFSAKHVSLQRKIKYWLVQNRDNVSEWSDMLTQSEVAVLNPAQRVGQEQSGPHHRHHHHHHLIEFVLAMIKLKMAELALNNNHSLFGLMMTS